MIDSNYIIFLILCLTPLTTTFAKKRNLMYECVLHNQEYKYEYLYVTRETDESISDTTKLFTLHKVYTYPLIHLNDFDRIKWRFELIKNQANDTYYLINLKYNEYLCATDSHSDYFFMRRKVNTARPKSKYFIEAEYDDKMNEKENNDEVEGEESDYDISSLEDDEWKKKCEWKFESIDENKKNYIIWNVFYQEPLYAASGLFKPLNNHNRNIFTWYGLPNSNQFVWRVDCNSGFD
jgi:hypothetical protein